MVIAVAAVTAGAGIGFNNVVGRATTIPVMSVDGWCNVVAGGGCDDDDDDITMVGTSVFMDTVVDGEGIIVGDVDVIIMLVDASAVGSLAGAPTEDVAEVLLFGGAGSI